MAKVKLDYMSLSMRAEGSDDMVRELSGRFLDMADKYAAPGFYFPALPPSVFEDGCRDPEELNTGDMKPLTTPKEVAPGADWDVVAIYDDAGIPSIMHRFRRMSNKELFGGSDKPHPACPVRGGTWYVGEGAGVFYLNLHDPRSNSWTGHGGRSAFFKKKQKAER